MIVIHLSSHHLFDAVSWCLRCKTVLSYRIYPIAHIYQVHKSDNACVSGSFTRICCYYLKRQLEVRESLSNCYLLLIISSMLYLHVIQQVASLYTKIQPLIVFTPLSDNACVSASFIYLMCSYSVLDLQLEKRNGLMIRTITYYALFILCYVSMLFIRWLRGTIVLSHKSYLPLHAYTMCTSQIMHVSASFIYSNLLLLVKTKINFCRSLCKRKGRSGITVVIKCLCSKIHVQLYWELTSV